MAVATSPARPASRATPSLRGVVLALFVASGAAGLIYQVVWSRELVLVFGNTTQAVATSVTAFMAGLLLLYLHPVAVGAGACGRLGVPHTAGVAPRDPHLGQAFRPWDRSTFSATRICSARLALWAEPVPTLVVSPWGKTQE